jgi:hypothetical protein
LQVFILKLKLRIYNLDYLLLHVVNLSSGISINNSKPNQKMEQGAKIIQNKTTEKLMITLTGRIGSNPDDQGTPVEESVDVNESKKIVYGNDQNPYLNEMQIEMKAKGEDYIRLSLRVLETGSPVDSLFNNNTALIITEAPFSFSVEGGN